MSFRRNSGWRGLRAEASGWVWPLLLILGLGPALPVAGFAAPNPSDRAPALAPSEGKREGKELVAEMLAQRPEQDVTNTGVLKIRDESDQQRTIPVRLTSLTTATNWISIYETRATPEQPAWKLEVFHTPGKSNRYFLSSEAKNGATARKELEGNATMIPFAGSDFWVADLGMEFLSWPQQRIIKSDMRHSRACRVLESINPHPAANAYSKVVSWITVESPHGPAHADAYDANGARIKEFDPKTIERLHGSYQLRSVEMRNLKKESSTILEFDNPE